MDQRIINLYDRFTHGFINRREFLDRLGEFAGSAAAAAALLPLLQNDPAKAAAVAPDDLRLLPDFVTIRLQMARRSPAIWRAPRTRPSGLR